MTIAMSHKIDPATSDRWRQPQELHRQGLKLTNFAPERLGAR
jgi:hypothetical protein